MQKLGKPLWGGNFKCVELQQRGPSPMSPSIQLPPLMDLKEGPPHKILNLLKAEQTPVESDNP